MREGKSGWQCICKCFVNYRWKGLTGRYGCGIIEMSREENRYNQRIKVRKVI
jgi:hypothetical protein